MKVLMKGNEVIGEAAVRAGCRAFFGYPITPQTELPEYLAHRMPEVGGVFLQAESELAAINMVYGAAGAGARVMTSSSGPGISLKAEGISYLAGAQLPCVIVNIMRGGPGLGGIQPSQADYFQATRGGGHGDYRVIVLAPASVQEMADLTAEAFELADRYRNPVMLLGDGILGQMMEAVEFKPRPAQNTTNKHWATTGRRVRSKNIINSLYLDPELLEKHNLKLQQKFSQIAGAESRAETYRTEDAAIIVVAFGTAARIARTAVDNARARGIRAGLIRPITLWPFPELVIRESLGECRAVLTVEMNAGQMLDDVRLAVNGTRSVHFYGRMGGMVPSAAEVLRAIEKTGGMDHGHESCQA